MKTKVSMDCAKEALRLVGGGRQDAYGRPERSLKKIARVWEGLLLDKLAPGARISALDVAILMTRPETGARDEPTEARQLRRRARVPLPRGAAGRSQQEDAPASYLI